MNQLFYNVAGGIVHQVRCEKRTTTSEVSVRGKQNKQNRNWLYFNFSVEGSSFIFNNFKTEKFKLTFKGWHRPVCQLFGFTECLPVKIQLHFTASDSEANRDGADAESPFSVVFSLFLPHLGTLAQEKRSEIVFVLGLVGRVSVCIHYCREVILSPR